MDSQYVFLLLLALRLVNALTLRTFFQPDEYFQALEPAWKLAFGEGSAAWITWEWRQHLRSAIHPALFSLVLALTSTVLSLFPRSTVTSPYAAELYEAAPRVLQAIIAASGDYYTWKLGERVYGHGSKSAWTTLLLTIFSPWQWLCSTRTFSNCLESTLTVYALYRWPFEWNFSEGTGSERKTPRQQYRGKVGQGGKDTRSEINKLRRALFCAALATVLRPTNIIIWTTLAALGFANSLSTQSRSSSNSDKSSFSGSAPWTNISILIREGVICGGTVLGISAIVDRAFYQVSTFPPYNFLYFNVVQSLAVFYGNNDWHYYLSQGYPLLLIAALPFTLLGLYRMLSGTSRSVKQYSTSTQTALYHLSVVCLMLPLALSILSHKEVRFIYPLLPLLHIIAALPLSEFARQPPVQRTPSVQAYISKRNILLAILITLNVTVAYYVSYIHNSGILTLPTYLRHEFKTQYLATSQLSPTGSTNHNHKNMTVGFLMPCHSTPWRSHLQYPPSALTTGIQAWALTCEPPLHIIDPAEKRKYRDEADQFYDNTKEWLDTNMVAEASLSDNINNNEHKAAVTGQDIIDLLPQLITHPPSSLSPSIPNNTTESPAVNTTVPSRRAWPDYLIFFAALEPTLHCLNIHQKPFLRTQSQQRHESDRDTEKRKAEIGHYRECYRQFNSHFHDDWRRVGDVVVWCMN